MEIEYKNSVKDMSKGIYKVGNVISRFGSPFLVARDDAGFYCLVDLSNGRIFTTILSEVIIGYGDQVISIGRYYGDNWEIHDETYISFKDFRVIGKILDIVTKHLSKIKLK